MEQKKKILWIFEVLAALGWAMLIFTFAALLYIHVGEYYEQEGEQEAESTRQAIMLEGARFVLNDNDLDPTILDYSTRWRGKTKRGKDCFEVLVFPNGYNTIGAGQALVFSCLLTYKNGVYEYYVCDCEGW